MTARSFIWRSIMANPSPIIEGVFGNCNEYTFPKREIY